MAAPSPEDCSIKEVTLEANHILHITAADNQNQTQTASIDLDSIIGNVNGALSLGATGFSSQARNVKLENNGSVLDADLPDVNGDYSTSSCSIQHEINTVEGQLALLFAIGAPHSVVHAEADTVAAADQQITEQVQTVGASPPVAQMMTLHLDSEYGMDNPNKAWVKENLGPQGAVGAAIQLVTYGLAVMGGVIYAAQQGYCVIL